MQNNTTENAEYEYERKTELPLGIKGLGGWLILPQIGLYISFFTTLVHLIKYSIPSLKPEVWNALTDKSTSVYHPLWGPTIIFDALSNLLLCLFAAYALYNLYRKKHIFPNLMIILYCASLVIVFVDYSLTFQIQDALGIEEQNSSNGVVRAVVTCAVWIPYFRKSERVKNTFVN